MIIVDQFMSEQSIDEADVEIDNLHSKDYFNDINLNENKNKKITDYNEKNINKKKMNMNVKKFNKDQDKNDKFEINQELINKDNKSSDDYVLS